MVAEQLGRTSSEIPAIVSRNLFGQSVVIMIRNLNRTRKICLFKTNGSV